MARVNLDRCTVPIYSPLHRRTWYITPRQFRLVCAINGRRQGSQRELAAEVGYSRHGLHRAIRSLGAGGIVAVLTRRGRAGWTLLQQRAGAHVQQGHELNAPVQGTPVDHGDDPTPSTGANEQLLGRITRAGRWDLRYRRNRSRI